MRAHPRPSECRFIRHLWLRGGQVAYTWTVHQPLAAPINERSPQRAPHPMFTRTRSQTMKSIPRSTWILSLGVIATAALTTMPASVLAEIVNLAAAAPASVANYRPTFTGRGYYVDSIRGSDSSGGTEANPWRTLARASQATLSAGDALLLRCGRQFRESVEFTSKFAPNGSVLIGGYGDCTGTNRPEIIGSETIPPTAWQVSSGDANGTIYKAQFTGEIAGVLRNNEPQLRARQRNYTSPTTEFSISKAGTNSNQIALSDTDRQAVASRDIIGATIVIRSAPFHVENNTVRSYDPALGIITLSASTQKPPTEGAGYYIEGKQWMLDADKEWLADASQNIYIYIAKSAQINALSNIEVNRLSSTLKIKNIRNIRVERLRINNSGLNGIHLINSGDAKIEDVSVSYSLCSGIFIENTNGLPGSDGASINSSLLYGNKVSGISSSAQRTSITLNKITGTGTLPGHTSNGAAIRLSGAHSTAESNDIYMSGQYGILFSNKSGDINILKNLIKQTCLRLSDCGGIYSWGSNETGAQSSISSNQISSLNAVNTNGAAGGAPDLVAGIYLDELSNNINVIKNSISDVRHGIYLHKANNNRIAWNIIESASQAGIRVGSDWQEGTTAQGNRIEYNTFYVPNFFKLDVAGVPQKSGGVVQEWVHVTDSSNFFNGPNKNVSDNNTVVHLGDGSALRWRLQSGSAVSNVEPVGWKNYSSTDFTTSPFRGRMATVTGKQIIRDSTLDGLGFNWETYSYQPSVKIASFSKLPQCSGSCALFNPVTNNDVLYQQNLISPSSNSSLMFFRYRAISGNVDSSSKLEVRSDAPPYLPAGYLEDLIPLPRNSERRQESFFKRTTNGNLRLSIKAAAGSSIMIDDVELFEVGSFNLLTPISISRLLVNPSDRDALLSCVDLNTLSCALVDSDGRPLNLPIIIGANSQKLVFLKSGAWSY